VLVILPSKDESFLRGAETPAKDVVERIKVPTPAHAGDQSLTYLIIEFLKRFEASPVD
jgi:hypothetical protein